MRSCLTFDDMVMISEECLQSAALALQRLQLAGGKQSSHVCHHQHSYTARRA